MLHYFLVIIWSILRKNQNFNTYKGAIYENIVGEEVDKEKFTLSSNIKEDLGINSVGLLYLIVDIENKFDVVLHNQSIEKFVTLDDVVTYIEENI